MDVSYHRHDINDKVWRCSNHIYRDNEASGAGLLRITIALSTQYFGFCELSAPMIK